MKLVQVVGQLKKVLEQDSYDLLQQSLDTLQKFFVLIAPSLVLSWRVIWLVLIEQVRKSAHNQVYCLDLEFVVALSQILDLVPKKSSQGRPDRLLMLTDHLEERVCLLLKPF